VTVEEFLAAATAWADSRPDVRGLVLVGSQARTEIPADEYSDIDLAVFADDPEALLADGAWVERFGEPLLSFLEPTAVGGSIERRVLFENGLEADFSVFPAAGFEGLAGDPRAAATLARGYRILYDDLGLDDLLGALRPTAVEPRDLAEIAQDFWYHAIWAAKKWRRGEAIVARSCLEGHLKALLLEADRLRAAGDTWHGTRFAETWATREVVEAWWQATARAPDELPAALARLCDAFAELSSHEPSRSRLEELLS
jgi:aminoglycoside 6-adenylyltransferase